MTRPPIILDDDDTYMEPDAPGQRSGLNLPLLAVGLAPFAVPILAVAMVALLWWAFA